MTLMLLKQGKQTPKKIKNYILAGNLPATVKMHLIGLMPAAPTTKGGFVSWVSNLFAPATKAEESTEMSYNSSQQRCS